jgi:IclR family acetate operon transcriptional repressor
LGYGVDREECVAGMCCVASPLRDHVGNVVGAISTSMPSSQFILWDESSLGAHLKAAALNLSAAMANSKAASF